MIACAGQAHGLWRGLQVSISSSEFHILSMRTCLCLNPTVSYSAPFELVFIMMGTRAMGAWLDRDRDRQLFAQKHDNHVCRWVSQYIK